MAGTGLETRTSILPTLDIGSGPGVLGPDYSFADNLKIPKDVGVAPGDSLGSVTDAIGGVKYYVDMIGFGKQSLSSGLGAQPLGVNFFMKTGYTCSNGADMWQYIESIPKGDAFGQRVKEGLRQSGITELRGLAPGIIEDAKDALDPRPIANAVFGNAMPQCKWEERPVGDQDGRIQNPQGKSYIENPETAVKRDNQSFQGRWVFDKFIEKDAYENAPKTHCPDGYPKKNHQNGDCSDRILVREPFQNKKDSAKGILLGAAILGSLLLLKFSQRK